MKRLYSTSKALTKNEKEALAFLKSNKDIITQRPKKGGGAVVLDKEYTTTNSPTLFPTKQNFISTNQISSKTKLHFNKQNFIQNKKHK